MVASIYPSYPPHITEDEKANLLAVLNDWADAHGLLVRPPTTSSEHGSRNTDGGAVITAPVALFPSPFPRSCYEEGIRIQKSYNSLYAAIARDEAWLGNVMKE